MVRGAKGGGPVLPAGRVLADLVAEEADAPGLVVRHPVLHAVAQVTGDHVGVFGEGLGRGTGRPAALVLERLRQVPVIERGEGLDARLQQGVDQAAVEIQARPG